MEENPQYRLQGIVREKGSICEDIHARALESGLKHEVVDIFQQKGLAAGKGDSAD